MNTAFSLFNTYAKPISEALSETLWPTRCIVCDTPGEVLCPTCRAYLHYLDWWRACPRCGAPFGRNQCSECNPVILRRFGCSEPPFDSCTSAVVFDEAAGRIVRGFKDYGEQRLAVPMAALMANTLNPAWIEGMVVSFVPASLGARRRRGYDHSELLAQALAYQLHLPCKPSLKRPRTQDQRTLTRQERIENLRGRFEIHPSCPLGQAIVLVDDVYTTGATLFGATTALKQKGAPVVRCITFARVW